MAYQVGAAIGIEGKALGINGLYGPGANLHRSPMGGRNFEYFSEDGVLSGIMCAYEVYGGKEQGLTMYVKHIAVNDSDSGRNGAYKWLTEQNLRENYLKPFELLVKVGHANAFMTSVDRIGSTRASSSYAMLTAVVRNEWGFKGTIITDYYQNAGASRASDTTHDVDECVRAGNSQLLYPDGSISFFNDTTSNTAKKAIFKSAKDILFAYADTLDFAATAQGLEKSSLIVERSDIRPWWIPALIGIDNTFIVLAIVWVGNAIKSYRKKNGLLKEKPKTEPTEDIEALRAAVRNINESK
jgi:beta-glucosidase